MSIGERIKRQLTEGKIKEEEERLRLIEIINTTSKEFNKEVIKEVKPLLEVLEEAGLYGMFKNIRRTFNLEWERKFRKEQGGCLMLIPALIDSLTPITDRNYDITPAILDISIQEESGPFLLIGDQGQDDVGFGTEELLVLGEQGKIDIFESVKDTSLESLRKRASYLSSKKITIENCSLKLKWGLKDYEVTQRGDTDYITWSWNQLVAEVARDRESGLPFITIKAGTKYYDRVSLRLAPNEWQDREKLEETVASVYLQAFHE